MPDHMDARIDGEGNIVHSPPPPQWVWVLVWPNWLHHGDLHVEVYRDERTKNLRISQLRDQWLGDPPTKDELGITQHFVRVAP